MEKSPIYKSMYVKSLTPHTTYCEYQDKEHPINRPSAQNTIFSLEKRTLSEGHRKIFTFDKSLLTFCENALHMLYFSFDQKYLGNVYY